jgi:hypothetical protein
VALLLTTIVNAHVLLPLNKLWVRLGQLIGAIISPIVLGIIFFGIVSPYALVMRLFGRDELRLKLGKQKSYWKSREQFTNQINFRKQY